MLSRATTARRSGPVDQVRSHQSYGGTESVMPKQQAQPETTAAEGRTKPRRLRSSTVILGGMGVLAAALSACGSEPDRRCVDRSSYDFEGYKVVNDSQCRSTTSGSGGRSGKRPGGTDAQWYYDSDRSGQYADDWTFSKSTAVNRGGFGCSGKSGSFGG
jgi:hypothetical protein